MKKQRLILFCSICLFAMIGLSSCQSDGASDSAATDTTTATTGDQATATPMSDPAADGAAAAAPTGPTTTMTFEGGQEFNYGTINAGEKVKHTFKFKNTGSEPLVITNCKGSCGCTVPKCPTEPIAPGETGEIPVEFDSKGKNGPDSKNVTVTANTNPAQTMLTIKGDVKGTPPPAQ